MVPLVFKTSLGVVRSPEGSTPSLLRHNRGELLLRYRAVSANRVFSVRENIGAAMCAEGGVQQAQGRHTEDGATAVWMR